MTSSATYNFASTFEVADLITDAFERCGIFGDKLQQIHVTSALRSCNLLFADWSNDGPSLFGVETITQALTAATASYTLSGRVISVMHALIRDASDSNRETWISPMSRAEYVAQSDKTTAGPTTRFYLDRVNPPVLYTYPVVSESSRYTAVLYCLRDFQDVSTTLTETLEQQKRWLEAIASGLAMKLSVKFAPARYELLAAEAGGAYGRARMEDTEKVPFRIVPDMGAWQ